MSEKIPIERRRLPEEVEEKLRNLNLSPDLSMLYSDIDGLHDAVALCSIDALSKAKGIGQSKGEIISKLRRKWEDKKISFDEYINTSWEIEKLIAKVFADAEKEFKKCIVF